MDYLLKLVITLIVAVATCVAAWYAPSWAWTFGWVGASLCSIFFPYGITAYELAEPTREAPPMPACKPPRTEQADRIQAFNLSAGDTLIIEHANKLTYEQCAMIDKYAGQCIPDGCKVMVLHGGMKVAGTITARDPNAEALARLDAHNLD